MPMKWDAAAYSKLFAATVKIHDIKPDYAALAAEMGNGCTAKAVSHQFSHLRALANGKSSPAAKAVSTPGSVTPRANSNAAAKLKSNVNASTSAKKKGAIKSRKIPEEDDTDGDDGDDGVLRHADYDELDASDGAQHEQVSPSVDRSQLRRSTSVHAKRIYAEKSDEEDEDEEETPKRVKREDSFVLNLC